MTLATDKLVSELALKMLRGEDIEADIKSAFQNLSEIERRILINDGMPHAILEHVAADPSLEIFTGEDGETYFRRAAA